MHLVTMVTMGPVCLMKLTRKRKLIRTLGFFLDLDTRVKTCGDHVTSVSDEIDEIMKVGQNTWFFLRFFPPAHFHHWQLRKQLLKVCWWVGGTFDYSVSPGPYF